MAENDEFIIDLDLWYSISNAQKLKKHSFFENNELLKFTHSWSVRKFYGKSVFKC